MEIEKLLAHIEKETATLNQTIRVIEQEIALVQEYRTALIAEAVMGKIDVRGYEVPALAEADEVEEELEVLMELGEEEEGV